MSLANIRRGDIAQYNVQIFGPDGNPQDITSGFTIRFSMKLNTDTSDGAGLPDALGPLILTPTTPAEGRCLVTIPASLSKDLKVGQYYYDLQVENTISDPPIVVTADFGLVYVEPDVTRITP